MSKGAWQIHPWVVVTLVWGLISGAIVVSVYLPFFRSLPSSETDRLVRFWQVHGEDRFRDFSSREWERLGATSTSFEAIAGISFLKQTLRQDDRQLGTVTIGRVTPDFFDVFRVEPLLGRAFMPKELLAGAPVVVLGRDFWADRFGGDPRVVGQSVLLQRQEYTVIGVISADLRTPSRASLWRPFQPNEVASKNQLIVVGRVNEDIPIEQAAERLETTPGGASDGIHTVWIEPFQKARSRHGLLSLLLLSTFVAVVLLTASLTFRESKKSVATTHGLTSR